MAAAAAIDELGYPQTSVARITARARVSRRTFYELFGNREECLVALLDDVILRVEQELAVAGLERLAWRERVREGLWVILSFLEREPALARICVVQACMGGRGRSSVASGSLRGWRVCSMRGAGRAPVGRSALW